MATNIGSNRRPSAENLVTKIKEIKRCRMYADEIYKHTKIKLIVDDSTNVIKLFQEDRSGTRYLQGANTDIKYIKQQIETTYNLVKATGFNNLL